MFKVYFFADLDLSAKGIIEYCRIRFQIEFCMQFTGFNDCQARDLKKFDFAFNFDKHRKVHEAIVLSVALHWLSKGVFDRFLHAPEVFRGRFATEQNLKYQAW